MNDELIIKVESLKNLLVAFITGGQPNNVAYKKLRQELTTIPRVEKLLPRFVFTCRELYEFWGFIKPKIATYAERREFLSNSFDPLLTMLESEARSPSDAAITKTVQAIDATYIQEVWSKALERRGADPEGAITAARTLLESVCKYILDAVGLKYDDNIDLPRLYTLTSRQLNLSPSQHTEPLFRQITGGCHAVVEGLGALRNQHSDAHGKGVTAAKPVARHAELAVNLSGAMAMFLLQTWEERKTT